jgi:hypothetical protein
VAEGAVVADIVVPGELLEGRNIADIVISGEKIDGLLELGECILESLDLVVVSGSCFSLDSGRATSLLPYASGRVEN